MTKITMMMTGWIQSHQQKHNKEEEDVGNDSPIPIARSNLLAVRISSSIEIRCR